MPRRHRKRPNWPYRTAWLTILLSLACYVGLQSLRGAIVLGQRSSGPDWTLSILVAFLDATFAFWFVAVGASIGSFLNVVAFRLPLGRHIGGHSGCFYCQTPIESRDNVPVLAWLKLRGRCRTCRLPISIQYPLVELGVGLVFLFVYLSEVSISGTNLPGADPQPAWGALLRITSNTTLILRAATYLMLVSGLIAAALIAARRQAVPLKLYAWALLPWLLAVLVRPEIVIVEWRQAQVAVQGTIEPRLDALITMLCGSAAAIAVARLIAPLLFPRFDRGLIASDSLTNRARQWIGAMAIAGAMVGWQAVVPLAWSIVVCGGLAMLMLRRFRQLVELGDLTVWIWLGLLIFRANWSWLAELELLPDAIPTVLQHLCGALALAPVVWLMRNYRQAAPSGASHSSSV